MTGHLAAVPGAWAAAVLLGLAVLALPGRPRALRPGAGRRPGAPAAPGAEVDPPLVLDLVAAVITAGAPPVGAVRAVAAVLREEGAAAAAVAEVLEAAATGPPRAGPSSGDGPRAGTPLAEALAALRRCLWIAEQTGAPVAALLTSAAAELRRRRRRAGALAAARLGVRVVAPLGLCTLPAFGLLAVVPVLLSLGRDLLG